MADGNTVEDDESEHGLLEHSIASSRTSLESFRHERLDPVLSPNTARLLYVSHFLSTWNSRTFEFGAFLFLATIYPQTLLPASVYALARGASAATLSPWIGNFIDHSERLIVVRLSIIGQRTAVIVSCMILYLLVQLESLRDRPSVSYTALAVLSILACVEKLYAVMNTISVEREWVVVIAGDNEEALRTMNSQMRRIDLFCKLVAPLLIAFVDGADTKIAVLVTGAMTAASVFVEYFAIERVYKIVPELRQRKNQSANRLTTVSPPTFAAKLKRSCSSVQNYFGHKAFLPSFSLALLYLTVLSFNGQMTTYLIAIGVQSSLIGILRGISAACELSATWIAPRIMQYIGPVRSGIWFLNWQTFCVSIACACFWFDLSPVAAAAGTIIAVIASRVGLWGFDLSAQIIVQEEVEAEFRGAFSSQEFAFQNFFEMMSFASTIVFARPAQFKWPATISAAAVGVAGMLYAAFVRSRRGHLVHLSNCIDRHTKSFHSRRWSGRVAVFHHGDEYDDGEGGAGNGSELTTIPVAAEMSSNE